ncbi:Dps family protein [Paenibacillus mesotrionivorans]|jgi:starvation-inducible DNA-binding protein|uniref:Dps family protein n=1 Tax=Paenibacillus mesotrionivorans TaxID=3160968 RepID=A0ACC7NQK0_9BACL
MAKVMMKTGPRADAKPVLESLNKQVAEWTVLYMKWHHYHWYLTGESFFTLHEKFEQLYNEAALNLDELAERMLALDGAPASTLKECLSLATIKEATGKENPTQMVESAWKDLEYIAEELSKGIELADENKDDPTADMLTGLKGKVEKHIWMLKSYLK